jgi:poly(3-hydroxybutyrate) depolymerase
VPFSVKVNDPGLGPVDRVAYVTRRSDRSAQLPLVLAFHGQTENATDFRTGTDGNNFDSVAVANDVVVIYPQGMGDGTQGTGWNVGTQGDNATCYHEQGFPKGSGCYASCAKAGMTCGLCDWSTCYDDVAFVTALLDAVTCVDRTKAFIYGESNGGMMVHHLITAMPGVFAAAVPVYGLPLLGYMAGTKYEMLVQPAEVAKTSLFALHDLQDVTIPLEGMSADGWYYESFARTMGAHAVLRGCETKPQPTAPYYPDSSRHPVCYIFPNCRVGHVRYCLYTGNHGDISNNTALGVWQFFLSHLPTGELVV